MTEYADESGTLDADILHVIHAWHRHGTGLDDDAFDRLALRILAYQLRYNAPYAAYCAARGVTLDALPSHWNAIPPAPSAAFKDATLTTFNMRRAALRFQTSGTTQGRSGLHYMETAALYDAALLAGFDRAMLADAARPRFFNVVPNPHERPQSSLGYMMGRVSAERGDRETGWYLRGDELLFTAFCADLEAAIGDAAVVCIAGTAFGLLEIVDLLARQERRYTLPAGSRIMETGGFKGRTREVSREDLYAQLARRFGIDSCAIVAEYGMTELTSQYYDTAASRSGNSRVKTGPPWLRARVVDVSGARVPPGAAGALVHCDLANRSSVVAVATEDLAYETNEGFVLLGRDSEAPLRGCSLDAEQLATRE